MRLGNEMGKRKRTRTMMMRGSLSLVAALLLSGLVACDDDDDFADVNPPAIPNGVFSITADNEVWLVWNPNRERDLDGYNIWWNANGGTRFELIGTIDATDPTYYDPGFDANDPGDDFLIFSDIDVINGEAQYYAVSAFDRHGNESDLSLEFVRDVPRPEGFVDLTDRFVTAAQSGYDLSGLSEQAQPFNLATTDVWFERLGPDGVGFLTVDPTRVLIQDYGNVGFDVASWAPLNGWSALGQVEAIEGHTYILRVSESVGAPTFNFAKLTILDLAATSVELQWGYQIVEGEQELLVAPLPQGDEEV